VSGNLAIAAVVMLQSVCAVFFVADILISVAGLDVGPIDWQLRELIEIGAAIGLILGVAIGAASMQRLFRRTRSVERTLRAASGEFLALLGERFQAWRLTPAERDVALFAIKGMTTAEIAALRGTSEGTVKAQTNAIYRKAGVNGRAQLLSLFIDELMGEGLAAARAAAPAPPPPAPPPSAAPPSAAPPPAASPAGQPGSSA